MTLLTEALRQDERFKRCLESRKSGKISVKYAPPFPDLPLMEKQLGNLEIEIKKTNDPGVHEMATYFREYVALLQDFEMNPEGLELAIQEFAIAETE